jgi:hypothetical protein
MAQPQARRRVAAHGSADGDHRLDGVRVHDVEGKLERRAACLVELFERRDVRWQGRPLEPADPSAPNADDAIVIEDGNAVGGEPDVALEAGGPELQREPERLDGVLGGVGPGPAVGESDRWPSKR